jgi:hypothetical protein
MNLVARIISVVFHPLLMATYLFAILAFTLPSALSPIQASGHLGFLLLIFLVSFVLPALNIGIFRVLGSVQSLTMYNRSERVVPFSFIAVLYLVVTYLFLSRFRIGLTDNAMKLMLVIDALVVISALVTFFYKVSVHSLGICGLLGILIPFNKVAENNQLIIPTVAFIIIAGLVMSSRLQLHAHKPREILVGALLGLITGFGGVIFLF